MKCPHCGKEIAEDSLYCEFCGSQVRSIDGDGQNSSDNNGGLKAFLFLFIASTIILGILLASKSNELTSKNNELASMEYENNAKLSKLRQVEAISKTHPLVITDVKIGNCYENGDVETSFGNRIYSNRSMYLKPQISYIGIATGNYSLDVKLYDSYGNLSRGSSSPANLSYSNMTYIYEGYNESILSGWGNSTKGHWAQGKYKLEIWYSSHILFSKEFSIY